MICRIRRRMRMLPQHCLASEKGYVAGIEAVHEERTRRMLLGEGNGAQKNNWEFWDVAWKEVDKLREQQEDKRFGEVGEKKESR